MPTELFVFNAALIPRIKLYTPSIRPVPPIVSGRKQESHLNTSIISGDITPDKSN